MAEIDATSKQATIAHMNRDHSLDLGLYLRFVNGLSADQLAAEGPPEMVDMDLAAMHIRTATTGTVHVVPLRPPLAAWGERRQRLVDLAMAARTACGVPLPEHGPPAAAAEKQPIPFGNPGAVNVLVMAGVLLFAVLWTLVQAGRDAAACDVWTRALGAAGATERNFVFGGPDGLRRLLRLLGPPVLLIHAAETWWLVRTRLAPHGMTPLSRHGGLWTGLVFVAGAGAFVRFDQRARRQARAAAAAKKQQ